MEAVRYNSEESRVTIRPALAPEVHEYHDRKRCSIVWLVKRIWARVVAAVNLLTLIRTRDLKGIVAKNAGSDPYITYTPIYLIRQRRPQFEEFYVTSHPAIMQAVLEPPRHSACADDPYFMGANDLSAGILVSEMFKNYGAVHENFILTCSREHNSALRRAVHAELKPSMLSTRQNELQVVADQTVKEWIQLDGELNIRPLAKLYVNRVLSSMFLNYSEELKPLQEAVDTFSAYLMGQATGTGPNKEQLAAAQVAFEKAIKQAIAAAGDHNVAYQMKQSGKFSDADVYLMAWTLFFAGIDNSSESLTWTLLMLAQNPEVQEALRQDPDQMMGPVLAESLRTFPPAHGVSRVFKANTDMMLEVKESDGRVHKRFLEAGMKIVVRIAGAAIRPDLYGAAPEQFDPSRFKKGFQNHLTLPFRPFGGGAHVCPGWKLVMDEMSMLIRTLLQTHRITTKQMEVPQTRGTFLNKIDGDVRLFLEPLDGV